MTRFRRLLTRLFPYASIKQMLLGLAAFPVLYAVGCWQTPQIATFLKNLGLEVNLCQVFEAGLFTYVVLLKRHRALNRRHFVRYASEIEHHRQLTMTQQRMVGAGLTYTDAYALVLSERTALGRRLGFMTDGDNFYRKLNSLTDVLGWVCRMLKKF